MTYLELIKRVELLAPLPKTVIEIEKFKNSNNYEVKDLAKIIEQDPLTVSLILKTANSPLYGFASRIDNLNRAIGLLGINFTISIAMGSGVKKALNGELGAYGVKNDTFLEIASMQSNLVNHWIGKVDAKLKEELILPAFLQESGKFLLSGVLKDEGKEGQFLDQISQRFQSIAEVEREFLETTTAEVTSSIFKHWNIAPNIINTIKYTDDPSKAPSAFEKQAKILSIVKLVCNMARPFDQACIDSAVAKIPEYGLDLPAFQSALEKLRERLANG